MLSPRRDWIEGLSRLVYAILRPPLRAVVWLLQKAGLLRKDLM